MNTKLFGFGICVVAVLSILIAPALASAKGLKGTETSPLEGTWILEAADTLLADGSKIKGYGEHPQGRLMIDEHGRYSLQIYNTDSMKFSEGDKARGTPKEYKAAVMRSSTHMGQVTLDPTKGNIIFEVDYALFPNWEGKTQIRQYQISGDRLSYQVPATATGNGTIAISEWRRLPSAEN